ncbi:11295_t:CDS:2 [Paraglomus occultum]|uniref:DNA replication complex GINS protein PSF3 n=1 Tax=Paraglomus occultum TaxID=144539 RepID=A0A9N9FII7_9GLOM|nr:11295_t:CDS:2 [Paraglomus occultum]
MQSAEDFMDPDDFLAEEAAIGVKGLPFDSQALINMGVSEQVGEMGNNNESEERVERQIPYWVAIKFVQKGLGELQMPKIFGRPVRNALKADPVHVNLVEQDPRFFAFGGKFLEAVEDPELAEVLDKSYVQRTRATLDHLEYGAAGKETVFVSKMDETERQGMSHQENILNYPYIYGYTFTVLGGCGDSQGIQDVGIQSEGIDGCKGKKMIGSEEECGNRKNNGCRSLS